MNIEEKYPKDFQEFLAQFPNEAACCQYLIDIRWSEIILQTNATSSNHAADNVQKY